MFNFSDIFLHLECTMPPEAWRYPQWWVCSVTLFEFDGMGSFTNLKRKLDGGFESVLISPLFGEMIGFD